MVVQNNIAKHQGGDSNYIAFSSDTSATVESNTMGAIKQRMCWAPVPKAESLLGYRLHVRLLCPRWERGEEQRSEGTTCATALAPASLRLASRIGRRFPASATA